MAYVPTITFTKTEIADLHPDIVVGDITDTMFKVADKKVIALSTRHGIDVTATGYPTDDRIWSAAIFMTLYFLVKFGIITESTGAIIAARVGQQSLNFAKSKSLKNQNKDITGELNFYQLALMSILDYKYDEVTFGRESIAGLKKVPPSAEQLIAEEDEWEQAGSTNRANTEFL